ncbi:Nudix hydrolase 16, mitochondrial [Cocos nucifera]|uniref:Nudix hydrolase 16, mitochondrial n=1 Tax=Cocos nucifera TaxID=13894 RepID=A0A8K0IRH2_COCNU|nr:Nudix hydrolase 16, mitochondrial [Cocos nucifera]
MEMKEIIVNSSARAGLTERDTGSDLFGGGWCIPFQYRKCDESCGSKPKKIVEVLMINSQSGPGLLFPKGGWENDETVEEAAVREALEEAGVRGDIMEFLGFYYFKSKSHQDEFSPEGLCKAAMFAMHVKEELSSWPEQSTRHRRWLTIPEAVEQCRHPWMQEALLEGFSKWHANNMMSAQEDHPGPISSTPAR